MRRLPDGQLMRLYALGSQGAFEELFRRHEDRAFRFFLRRVHCEARARDLYQELFLRLHRFRHTYDASRPFDPWFFHIARRVLVDEWRRRFREARVDLDVAGLPSGAPDPEQVAVARHDGVRQLERLSPDEVRILVDAKVRGLGYSEIATALSRSVSAVKQTASRSLRRLRASPDARAQALLPRSRRAGQRPSTTPA
jgi:RNA polymerase sigma-70 factor, ECF subfamily